jgi:hypothetical protein
VAFLRPAAIAVHNDGDVLGQALQIEFREKGGFGGIEVGKEFGGFHSDWLKDEGEEKLAQGFMGRKDGEFGVVAQFPITSVRPLRH